MSLGRQTKSTSVWAAALALWAGFAFAGPEFVPGLTAIAIGLLLAAALYASTLTSARPPLLPLAMGGLALLSGLWAEVPSAAYAEGSALLGLVIVAAVLMGNIKSEAILSWLSRGFRYSALASVALAVAFPSVGVESRWPNTGAWTGLYVHKNILGTLAVFGIITLIYGPKPKRNAGGFLAGWAAIYLLLVVQSHSSAAIVLTAIVVGLWLALGFIANASRQRRGFVILFLIVGGILAGYTAFSARVDALGLIGRDLTFTGRTRIWSAALDAFEERPLLGFGYSSAFYPGTRASSIIEWQVGWPVPHAHNGFLSILLQLGVVGSVLAILLAFVLLTRTFRAVVADATPMNRWAFTVAVVFVINNVIDSRFDGLAWFAAVITLIVARDAAIRATSPGSTPNRPGFLRDTGPRSWNRTRTSVAS